MPVPEAAVRWSPAQQSMLRELGCELFTVRRPRAGGDPGATTSRSAPESPPARGRRVLVVHSPDSNWLRGPHAKLARGLLAAVGIAESDVRGEATPGAPAIAFGIPVEGALQAPPLQALRNAQAKRALWPALRAMRRRLRDAGTRG